MNKQSSPENLHDATPAPQAADKARVRAPAKAKPAAAKRTCIMVLGMHRTGTSALTRAISLLGADLPKNMLGANPTNLAGHWEPERLIVLHDRMLVEAGSRWDDWRAFDPAVLGEERLAHYRDEIKTLLLEEFGNGPLFVLKDPRICRFTPLYESVLADLGVTPLFVLPNRNPLAVIASLEKRGGMTADFACFVWLRHVLDAEAATRGKRRSFASYEAFLRDWRGNVGRIGEALDFSWPTAIDEAAAEIEAHLRPDLQHHASSWAELKANEGVEAWVRDAYTALCELDKRGPESRAALDELARIRREFDKASSVFGKAIFPELAAREQRASRQGELLADRAEEAEAGRSAMEGALASLEAEMSALQARPSEPQQADEEKSALAGHLATLAGEFAEQARSVATLHEATAQRAVEIATARHEVAAREDDIAALRAESAALSARLSGLVEENGALKERQAGLASELAAARETIASMSRESEAARETFSARDADIATLADEKKAYETQVALLLADRDNTRAEEKRLHGVLDAVYASTSWRLTKPVRGLKRGAVSILGLRPARRNDSPAVEPPSAAESPEAPRKMSEQPVPSGVAEPSFEALSAHPDESISEPSEIEKDHSKLIAFYLPQFHRIPENSAWWGAGFTEWTNVARAKPNFEGHALPNIPRELGYYDLTYTDTMREQAELAKLYGINGFCFYHYWFSGRRILETPVNNFMNSDIDINFCLCWANENWTRAWDGDTKSVLLEQEYAKGDAEAFFDSIARAFHDDRYIKVSGKPLLLVYRAKAIPNPERWFKLWRKRARQQGFPGLHISVVDFYDISDPREVGADSLVEFPPHKFNGPQSRPDVFPPVTNPKFAGGMVDYKKVISQSALRDIPRFKLFRGIIPSWDNTPRRQDTPTIVVNSNPHLYGTWLKYLRAYARAESPDETSRLIFVNAWNEWGEGCYLEPDQRHGLSYLEQTLRSSFYEKDTDGEGALDRARARLFEAMEHPQSQGSYSSVPGNLETASGAALVRRAKSELASYRAPSPRAQKASFALRKWPKMHNIAKFAYVLALRLRRRDG